MKRILPLVLVALAIGTVSPAVIAQDASPVSSEATPAGSTPVASSSLLESLGYPVIEFSTDGTMISGPSEVEAGRYLVRVESTSPIPDWELAFFSPASGMTGDDLVDSIAGIDIAAPGPPDFYYDIGHAGGISSPATEGIVELTPGEWAVTGLFFGETDGSVAVQKLTVTGEMTDYAPIAGAVQVTLADLTIEMPDSLPAGPQIWEVTNTGAMPHFVWVMAPPSGEITTEEAVNGVKLFYGMPDATPVAEGSAQDPMSWMDIGGSPTITGGVTTIIALDLAPGTYAAFCFLEGPGDLGSHALHGMTKVFTVE